MASTSFVNTVNFINLSKCISHPKMDYFPFNMSYINTIPQTSERQIRRKQSRMTTVAVRNQETDFADPGWKTKFEEDFKSRFNLPHLKDVLPVKPRPTTFSLKNRSVFHIGLSSNMLTSIWKMLMFFCLYFRYWVVLNFMLLVIMVFVCVETLN